VLTFGLGQLDKAERVDILWPSGQDDRLTNVAARETIVVTEGKGITTNRPYGKSVH